MPKLIAAALLLASTAPASAESFNDLCKRVSAEWGTQGDVAGQCSCLSEKTAADSALDAEMRRLAESFSSDADAYDAASSSAKAAFDACSVNS
jgi:hypothetical protein